MTDKLPNASTAYVDENRIKFYLLNPDHPKGGSKEKFFSNRGFSREYWQIMGTALLNQGASNLVTSVKATEWGTRYQVDCHCQTPDNSNPCVRTVWQIDKGDTRPRLLTAHPLVNVN